MKFLISFGPLRSVENNLRKLFFNYLFDVIAASAVLCGGLKSSPVDRP